MLSEFGGAEESIFGLWFTPIGGVANNHPNKTDPAPTATSFATTKPNTEARGYARKATGQGARQRDGGIGEAG
jgi:hypothetical protein